MTTMSNNNNDDDVITCQFIESKERNTSHSKINGHRLCFACSWNEISSNDDDKNNNNNTHRKFHRTKNFITMAFLVLILSLILNMTDGVTTNLNKNKKLNRVFIFHDVAVIKPIITAFIVILLTICAKIAMNTHSLRSTPGKHHNNIGNDLQISKVTNDIPLETIRKDILSKKDRYAQMLSETIKIPAISYDIEDNDSSGQKTITHQHLLSLHDSLRRLFPLLHKRYEPEIINKYSLLYKIPGANDKLRPIMFCAHLDVVPASAEEWDVDDPFGGEVIDGVIWGRGAIDNKHNLISQLAAIEHLISTNETSSSPPTPAPLQQRTIYIACGHDEEIGGRNGAAAIADHLKNQNIKLEAIFDEGPMMVSGAIPGLKGPLAMIGVSEKGYMDVELSLTDGGGHASMPPVDREGIISIMGRAISRLERHNLPAHFEKGSSFRITLESIASQLSLPMKVLCANFWLFGGLFKRILLQKAGSAAFIRTTTAVTKVRGGEKINSLPRAVTAYVNHRVHPMDTIEKVLEHDRRIINDERVKVRAVSVVRPSPTTSHQSQSFQWISQSVRAVFGYPCAPAISIGNTDTRWYWDLSDHIFRFSPVVMTLEETRMFHGINERIRVEALAEMVVYYLILIKLSDYDD